MKFKRLYSYLLRGSPVTFMEEIFSAKVEGKPAVLSRNGESIYFFQNFFALFSDFSSIAFNRKVCKEDAKNAKRKVNSFDRLKTTEDG